MKVKYLGKTNEYLIKNKEYDVFYIAEKNKYQIVDEEFNVQTVYHEFFENGDFEITKN